MGDSVTADQVRVLVVEDSQDQSGLLRRYLERAGCRVTIVETAEAAVESYLHETPDLAVIDLMLPGMNGWELAEKLRADRPDCPIAITSVLDPADFPLAEASLPKPFTGAQVLQVLSETVPRWVAG